MSRPPAGGPRPPAERSEAPASSTARGRVLRGRPACPNPGPVRGPERLDDSFGPDHGHRTRTTADPAFGSGERGPRGHRDLRSDLGDVLAAARRLERHPLRPAVSIDIVHDHSGGQHLTITGKDTAVPGIEESAVITVTSHAAVAPARSDRAGRGCAICASAWRLGRRPVHTGVRDELLRRGRGGGGRAQPVAGNPARSRRRASHRHVYRDQLFGFLVVSGDGQLDRGCAGCDLHRELPRPRRAGKTTSSAERNGTVTLDLQGFPQVPRASSNLPSVTVR